MYSNEVSNSRLYLQLCIHIEVCIEYPSQDPNAEKPRVLENGNLFIFGQLNES